MQLIKVRDQNFFITGGQVSLTKFFNSKLTEGAYEIFQLKSIKSLRASS